MFTDRIHWLNVKQISLFGLTGIVLGLVYISLVNGFSNLYPFVNGITAGILLGITIGAFEVYLFQPRLQRHPFVLMLFLRVIIYTATIIIIILIVVTLNRSIRHQQGFFEALNSQESQNYLLHGNFKTAIIFTFVAALIANFTRLISLKIGRGILTDFILGVYHKPKRKERIFVFLQITNAEKVLKNNQIETYHRFMNEIYRSISIAAIHNNGYVYEYVDDQIIVYWKGTGKNWGASLIHFYKEVLVIMKRDESYFKEKYNLFPSFAWGAHGGAVIQAEIGELKTEIVFHGDVLNTAARIANVATEQATSFVISNYIFEGIGGYENINTTSIGQIELRGKLEAVSLYSLTT